MTCDGGYNVKCTPQEQLLRESSHAIKLTVKNEAVTERPDQKEKQRQPKRNQFKGPRTILGLPLLYNNHAIHQPQVCIHQQYFVNVNTIIRLFLPLLKTMVYFNCLIHKTT